MKNKNVFLRISLIVCALVVCCISFFVPSKFENGVSALEVESDYNFIPIEFEEKSVTYTNTLDNSTSTITLSSLSNGIYRVSVDNTLSLGRASLGTLSLVESIDLLTGNYYAFYFCLFDFYSSTDLISFTSGAVRSVGFSSIPVGYPGGILGNTVTNVKYENPLGIGTRSSDTVLTSISFSDVNYTPTSTNANNTYFYDFSLYVADCGTSAPYNIVNNIAESQNSFLEGYNTALEKFGDIGFFNQSTWNAYFYGSDSFMFNSYQPVTSSSFTFGDGGIYLTNTGVYEYFVDNILNIFDEESGYVSFKKVALVSDYTKWSYSGMVFGNSVYFIFSDGTYKLFNVANGDLNYGSSYLDLSDSVGKTIVEVQIYFANEDSVPFSGKPIGLGSGTSFSLGFAQGYESGLKDNQSGVYDKGYAAGSANGYKNGYNAGLATAENASFFGLISAVIDVPLQFITSIFNFEILGINISSFLFALLSIAIIITIIKLVSKNE